MVVRSWAEFIFLSFLTERWLSVFWIGPQRLTRLCCKRNKIYAMKHSSLSIILKANLPWSNIPSVISKPNVSICIIILGPCSYICYLRNITCLFQQIHCTKPRRLGLTNLCSNLSNLNSDDEFGQWVQFDSEFFFKSPEKAVKKLGLGWAQFLRNWPQVFYTSKFFMKLTPCQINSSSIYMLLKVPAWWAFAGPHCAGNFKSMYILLQPMQLIVLV